TCSQDRNAATARRTAPLPQPISRKRRASGKNFSINPTINSLRVTNQKCLASASDNASKALGSKPLTVSASSGAKTEMPSLCTGPSPQDAHRHAGGQIASFAAIGSTALQARQRRAGLLGGFILSLRR